MYNVRIVCYSTGYQVRVYNRCYGAQFLDGAADEVETEYNPFTEREERIKTLDDMERSKRVSRSRTVNKLYHLTRSNDWEWFVTLTFAPDKVDSLDYGRCTKKLSKWLNNCKTKSPSMKYIVVPEKHESGRYHFHGLLAGCDGLEFVESGHVTDAGQMIYNIGSYRMGFTTATKVSDSIRVAKYITKYITKDLCSVTFNKRRYWASKNVHEADILDVIVEGKDMEDFIKSIADKVTYAKTVSSPIVTTDYYELDSVLDVDNLLVTN